MSDIAELINQVNNQDFAKAGPMFADIINAKLGDALEAEKIKVADTIFNAANEDELEDEDIDDPDDEDEDIDTSDVDLEDDSWDEEDE